MDQKSRLCLLLATAAVVVGLGAAPADAAATGWIAGTGLNDDAIVLLDSGGAVRTVGRGAGTPADVRRSSPSWDPTGRVVAYGRNRSATVRQWSGEIRTLDVATMREQTVLRVPFAGSVSQVAWSPDGRRLAFILLIPNSAVTESNGETVSGIFVVDANGKRLRPVVTPQPILLRNLVWSPNSRALAYESWVEGHSGVYTVGVETLSAPRLVNAVRLSARYPAWSPDGRQIAFFAMPVSGLVSPAHFDLWVVDRNGNDARRLAKQFYTFAPAWSPDGSAIVAVRRSGVVIVSTQGKVQQLSSTAFMHPAWSRSGTIAAVGYCERDGRRSPCGVFTLRVGEQPRRLGNETDIAGPIAWSA